jgi:lauroyl/myristoyl acyltransferase
MRGAAAQDDHASQPPARARGSVAERFRAAAAMFWLDFFFFHARHAPWACVIGKAFFLGFAMVFSRKIRANTRLNAQGIFGPGVSTAQTRQFATAMLGNFYDFVYDVGRSLGRSREWMLGRIAGIEGEEPYRVARRLGKGAIIVTAHLGSFEVGMAALLEREKTVHVIFKRDSSGRFEAIRSQLRRQLGVNEAPIDEGWTVWMRLRDALRNDEVVVVQGDRVMPGQKGQAVPFLHGSMLIPTGPAKLAMASGSPIIPIFSIRLPDGKVRIFIEEPIVIQDVEAGVRQIAQVVEKYVRAYPEQWLMLDRAFCLNRPVQEQAA